MTGLRHYSARVDVLRNGATYKILQQVGAPVIDMDADAEIKASMAGEFLADDSIDWLHDELMPVQIIDGVEYPAGIYAVATAAKEHNRDGVETITLEAYDRTLYLKQNKIATLLHLPAGERYLTVVEQLLVEAGIGLYIATETTATLQTDREDWPIGTSYLTIINQLLFEINYHQIWFDGRGVAVLEPIREVTADNVKHQYDQTAKVARNCKEETDTYNSPNYFIITCSNPDLPAPMLAVAENNDPRSALSTFRRGRRIVETIRVDNIGSQQDLEEMAQRVKLQSMMASETVTLYTANEGGHGVGDTVGLMHPDVEGLYREVGWNIVLKAGKQMVHRLRRSVLI